MRQEEAAASTTAASATPASATAGRLDSARAPARHRWPIALFLAAATAAVYVQSLGFDFISFDDRAYVVENPHVREGLTAGGIRWAFTTTQQSNWHPLTWLSLMIDAQIDGGGPRLFHATNVLLHVANVLLLFFVLDRMTGCVWRSAFVAALFAIHPLHAESVAWVAERKDVLSTLFWMLTMLFWLLYLERRGTGRYLWTVAAFTLGLMAKPMLVSLPLVLLLLDHWPLRRATRREGPAVGLEPSAGLALPDRLGRHAPLREGAAPRLVSVKWFEALARFAPLVREKLPFLVLSALSCIVTFIVQEEGGAVSSLAKHSLAVRTANAIVSYATYIRKMLWPSDLAFFYPHPRSALPAWQIGAAALFLAAATILALRAARSRPYLIVGWLWYIVTLVPVIGIVQVGEQAMADRYTYVPLIGLFAILAWGVPDLWRAASRARRTQRPDAGTATSKSAAGRPGAAADPRRGRRAAESAGADATHGESPSALSSARLREGTARGAPYGTDRGRGRRLAQSAPLAAGAIASIAVLMACTYRQAGRWRDSVTLYSHALAVTGDNAVAHNFLGLALRKQGKLDEAIAHFREAVRIEPEYREAYCDLASALNTKGQYAEAMSWCSRVLGMWPNNARAHADLGLALARTGKRDEAIPHLREAIRLKADYQDARVNLGVALAESGRYDEAIAVFSEAARADPDDADVRRFLELAREKAREAATPGR